MNRNLILALFSLLLIGLISSCSKKEDVAPVSPIVGQWDINRQILSNIPSSYSANGTNTTDLDADTYVFKSDGTFTNTYLVVNANGTESTRTDSGTWVLAGTIVTLTVTSQSPPSTYTLTYSVSASELTTGPLTRTYNGPNPVTGTTETFSYREEIVYKKKV